MIVSVSVIFFVLEAPVLIFICLMQGNYIQQSSNYIRFLWTLMNLMMYTNHVINFFSYCMTGTKFRRELLKLFYMHKAFRFMSVYKNVNMFTSAANHHHHHHNHNNHRRRPACDHDHILTECNNENTKDGLKTNVILVTKNNLNLISRNANAASMAVRNLNNNNKVIFACLMVYWRSVF